MRPPEDSGGVSGFRDMLKIIADPGHEEYESMMTWLGGEYDPEAFELAVVNRAILDGRRGRER